MNEVKTEILKETNAKIATKERNKRDKSKGLSTKELSDINAQIAKLQSELEMANKAFESEPNNATIEANRLSLQMQIATLQSKIDNSAGLF